MEFSITSYLILLALSGLTAFIAGKLTEPYDDPSWFGNILLTFGLAGCVALSQYNPGLGFLAVVVAAAVAGANCTKGLKEMTEEPKILRAAIFISAPLLAVAGVALLLSTIYLFIAFVFAHFPLPFDVPYSTVSSIFNWLFQKDFKLWDFYAFSAYLSITGSMALSVHWQDLVAGLKKLRQSPTAAPPAAPQSASGVND